MSLSVEQKTILVTGGSSGIGLAAAQELAQAGANVIVTSPSRARAESAAESIGQATGGKAVGLQLDLGSFAGIRAFTEEFLANHDHLDVLLNNAGALFSSPRKSLDGYEMTWAVNHLGPYLLTSRLMPVLRKAPAARIVTTASSAHRAGTIEFDGLGLPESYSRAGAYGRSKLANIMFTAALSRRLDGTNMTATCFHPGVVATGFFRFIPLIGPLVRVLATPFLRSPQKGAETGIFLAGDSTAEGASGGYYYDCKPARTSQLAGDVDVQEKVWEISAEQTGAVWDFS